LGHGAVGVNEPTGIRSEAHFQVGREEVRLPVEGTRQGRSKEKSYSRSRSGSHTRSDAGGEDGRSSFRHRTRSRSRDSLLVERSHGQDAKETKG
ncbi:unnamed protein product, partial [Discosporangium mesarthrocarpum]